MRLHVFRSSDRPITINLDAIEAIAPLAGNATQIYCGASCFTVDDGYNTVRDILTDVRDEIARANAEAQAKQEALAAIAETQQTVNAMRNEAMAEPLLGRGNTQLASVDRLLREARRDEVFFILRAIERATSREVVIEYLNNRAHELTSQ